MNFDFLLNEESGGGDDAASSTKRSKLAPGIVDRKIRSFYRKTKVGGIVKVS